MYTVYSGEDIKNLIAKTERVAPSMVSITSPDNLSVGIAVIATVEKAEAKPRGRKAKFVPTPSISE